MNTQRSLSISVYFTTLLAAMMIMLLAAAAVVVVVDAASSGQPPAVPVWPHPRIFTTNTADKPTMLCIPHGKNSIEVKIVPAPTNDDNDDKEKQELGRKNRELLQRAISRFWHGGSGSDRARFTGGFDTRSGSQWFIEQDYPRRESTLLDGRLHDLFQTQQQYRNYTRDNDNITKHYPTRGASIQLSIVVDYYATDLQLGIDESYTLDVAQRAADGEFEIRISAAEVWGALRSLATLEQLIMYNFDHAASPADKQCMYYMMQVPIHVSDSPRFPWRGLMIDTARHFYPLDLIKRVLDGMETLKLNVLHMHLTDAESFPLRIDEYPNLSAQGAFAAHLTYSADDLRSVVSYARDRGIRVVPELDLPGHSFSLGLGYPEWDMTIQCSDQSKTSGNINNYPVNPASEKLYEVVAAIADQLRDIFPDEYAHFGGDELAKACWFDAPAIQELQKERPELVSMNDVWAYFQLRLANIYNNRKKIPVFWQEIVLNMDSNIWKVPTDDSIITTWTEPSELKKVTNKGYRSLLSAGWYLDRQKPFIGSKERWLYLDTWEDMYNNNPSDHVDGQKQLDLVLGGEAAMWSEQIDIHSVESRIFPRLSAVAERLWSPDEHTKDIVAARARLIHHSCFHLARRGVRSSPIRPGYCPYVYTGHAPNDGRIIATVALSALVVGNAFFAITFGLSGIVIVILLFKLRSLRAKYEPLQ